MFFVSSYDSYNCIVHIIYIIHIIHLIPIIHIISIDLLFFNWLEFLICAQLFLLGSNFSAALLAVEEDMNCMDQVGTNKNPSIFGSKNLATDRVV